IRFTRRRLARFLMKRVPSLNYERVVALEARVRRSEVKRQYRDCMSKEYASIAACLPQRCRGILDIGCGIAGIDVHLDAHYEGGAPHFFLLDRSHVEERVYYMFEPRGAFYNSLELSRQVLVANGVEESRVTLLEATETNDIAVDAAVDLVLSLRSWGFHYPVGTYLDRVYELLAEGGCLILDVRKGTNGFDRLKDRFGTFVTLLEKRNHARICARKAAT
ncbi:MAG: class I SAM-dependent methyltransferase, partial [Acidobacteriota bacterium]